jgi:hypothetical protein
MLAIVVYFTVIFLGSKYYLIYHLISLASEHAVKQQLHSSLVVVTKTHVNFSNHTMSISSFHYIDITLKALTVFIQQMFCATDCIREGDLFIVRAL